MQSPNSTRTALDLGRGSVFRNGTGQGDQLYRVGFAAGESKVLLATMSFRLT